MGDEQHHDELWRTLYALKRTPRQGWLDRGIPAAETESVADHSHLTALIAWVVACDDETLDEHRVLQLATLHDVAESLVGDWPPYEKHELPDQADTEAINALFRVRHLRTPENTAAKRQAEADATTAILGLLANGARGSWGELLHEYELQQTAEARFVKQVDRLEAFIQSRLYAERYPDAPVWGFTDMAMKEITHPELARIRDAFLKA